MIRKVLTLTAVASVVAALGLVAAPADLRPDEVLARYPEGYTKVLVADLAALANDPALSETVLGGLRAARHPLNGIAQIVQDTLQLDLDLVRFVAHGEGPGLSPFSLIEGISQDVVFGSLMGLQFAAGAPGSPFTNWELTQARGLPLVRLGGVFGPVQIQWAYLPHGTALWVGTELSFGPPPDVARLEASADLVAARILGQTGYFDELLVALSVRGGQLAFVRRTDPATDRPLAAGETAMGFRIAFDEDGAEVHFNLRFASAAQAAAAQAALEAGSSPYLATGLYQGRLLTVRRQGTTLDAVVRTDLTGAVGLILTAMPN